ncbi:nitroreductase family deazaflavin-dependent oxidoreductase [Mycolicibacterium moriokaense]|uniref:Deazaflavin-dependent oxidoreductase (Nitroreductase family) n=1 Tax=Mycolicibacterium moriokaense TaxID=39691 RepID=A0A318HWB5_9MYCO|nr:nitroreductase family deazaflavin-dependent oxidoreductase [Mycolicibacterium moriokaense]PXX09684.1 deazaflavin-dependent oxidoreductase (nitroreductase family) [Mycolicibacterium moriokaense]
MSETPVTPVGPSLTVRLVMKPLTKILNPLVAAFAGRRHFPMAAQIHHVGRRTGKPYVTSVGARAHDGVVLIPLTFGNRSDWVRNVSAAGECRVRVNGADYHAVAPQFVTFGQAAPLLRPSFRFLERFVFRLLGIQQFMRLQLTN